MIRGTVRLGIFYLIVWSISNVWDGGSEFYRHGIDGIESQLPFPFTTNLFISYCTMAACWHLAGFWMWIYTVQVIPNKGPVLHSLPKQPLRHFFKLRVKRTTGAIFSSLLALLFALNTLHHITYPSFSSGIFDLVYLLPWLPGIGGRAAPWLVYGFIHIAAAALGAILLRVFNVYHFNSSKDRACPFIEYHLKNTPVTKFYIIVVLFAHYPMAAVTAGMQPHPFHGLVVSCSLLGITLAAIVGNLISLNIMTRHDQWFSSIAQKAQRKGVDSSEYKLCKTTLSFLSVEQSSKQDGNGVEQQNTSKQKADENKEKSSEFSSNNHSATASPGQKHKPGPQRKHPFSPEQSDQKSTHLLKKAQALLNKNKVEKACKILHKLTRHPDQKVRQHAARLLDGVEKNGSQSTFIRLVKITSIAVMTTGIILILGLAYQWGTLPGAAETRKLASSAHFHVRKYSSGGKSKIDLFGNRYDYSLNTSLENISKDFQHAVIASEDHRFYHRGVVYILAKFIQAGVNCAATKLNPLSTGSCQGNSTIGQQLARNLFLSEERSISRKLSELVWSLKMESAMKKDEILDFYMNRIYLGKGNYGIEMASRDYFKKRAKHLTTIEAAYLAAAIKSPRWNWYQEPENAYERARLILGLMKKYEYVDPSLEMPEKFIPLLGRTRPHKPYLGHLWQWAEHDVATIMKSLPNGNYKVLSTLNAEVQIYAEKALKREISRLKAMNKPVTQGAVVVMRPNGEVLAMSGGLGLKGRYFNRAKRTEGLLTRPPASTFKPFVYLAALESGLTPDSTIYAGPVSIPMGATTPPYQPQNHDGRDYGAIRLRDGLVHSINTAAVRLLYDRIGHDPLFNVVERLGIDSTTLDRQWGIALGQSGISLLEMTSAYCVFANGGKAVTPYSVSSITSESGKTIWSRPQQELKQVFHRQHISNINSMLRDVVAYGTAKKAAHGLPETMDIAGKTGTGDEFVDAWFIGYTPDLVIGIWIGNDTPVSMNGVYGGTGPARIFNDIIGKLANYTDITSLKATLP